MLEKLYLGDDINFCGSWQTRKDGWPVFWSNGVRSKNPDPSGGKAGARIGICEASVASIHKLAMSPRVFIRTHKKYFVMRATPEFNLALGICQKCLKIVVRLSPLLPPKKKQSKRNLMEPFQGSFLGAKCYLKRDENNQINRFTNQIKLYSIF